MLLCKEIMTTVYRLKSFCVVCFLMLAAATCTLAAVPAGYSEYLIPVSAQQAWDIFETIDNDPDLDESQGIHCVIAVAIATDNTTIYYDHWEDGLDFDPLSPSSTADVKTNANKGDVILFESDNIPISPRGTSAFFDGRDRIYVAGGAVTLSLSYWPEDIGTVFALAWELYPTKQYQTSYVIPVGVDLKSSQGYNDFDQVITLVQAAENGTSVQIDDPNTGGVDVDTTLNKGEVTSLFNHDAYTTITADKPVQVQFAVGQPQSGLYSEARGYTAVPSTIWHSAYYNPVPSLNATYDTEIYIYNPTTNGLLINYEISTGTNSFTVPAGETRSFSSLSGSTLPTDSALYIEAADGVSTFWAIGSGGTLNSTTQQNADFDYGFSLVPANLLRNEYLLGWAPGTRDLSANGSPTFITAVEDNTTVSIFYSPDDGVADASYVVDRIEVLRVSDPDNNNTGMRIVANKPVAVVWGEDAITNTDPYIDVGYSILPQLDAWVDAVLLCDKTTSPKVLPRQTGQTATFTITSQSEKFGINDIVVTDTLPEGWGFVNNSALVTLPDTTIISGSSANPDISGSALTWSNFPSGPLDLGSNETLTIVFEGITTTTPTNDFSINRVSTTGTLGSGPDLQTFVAEDYDIVTFSELAMTKESSAGGFTYRGSNITYTVTVSNLGSSVQNNIVINDPLPTGTTYVVQSTVVNAPGAASDYYDQFGAVSYINSDGGTIWSSTPWTESGDDNQAGSGKIQVTTGSGGTLRFGGVTRDTSLDTLTRPINLVGATSATLTFDATRSSNLESSDQVLIEVSANGGSTWTTLDTFSANFATGPKLYDISSYAASNSLIRFSASGYGAWDFGGAEYFYADNVRIQYSIPAITLDNIPGGANPDLANGVPPTLVTAADNIDLSPDGIMTVTFQVTVDDPGIPGQEAITNTAFVTSEEQIEPLEDTVIDKMPDFPFAALGDRVWLDENGDGVQDAGEDGIANVTVTASNQTTGVIYTNLTDSNGEYFFAELPPGDYTVTVDTSSLDSGVSANPTYDLDGIGTPHTADVTLGDNDVIRTVDFGYNWSPPTDTDNGTGTGAIGDRLWIDTDGDGVQDPDEAGLSGIEVILYSDPDTNGVYDTPVATVTTDATGNYIFDGLAAGAYVVEVNGGADPSNYTQTGDPDDFGAPADNPDNRTTVPVVLAPGDVFVNADFGYQPSGATGSIGDYVWFDADADGIQDAGEPGIEGVTVALIKDSNGNGVRDAGEPIIATDTTDTSGIYGFSGLPVTDGAGTDDYLVLVNDTSGILSDLDPTYDADGASTPNISAVTDLTPAGTLTQDFGYTAGNQKPTEGLIGDTIFIDLNGNGSPDADEGREGVTVELYDSTGTTLLTSTVTDENGLYAFGGLDPDETYVVTVAAANFASGGALEGTSNTVDPDGGIANTSTVDLSAAADGIDLDQDFGYAAPVPNAIGGTIWEDEDADGTLEGSETNRFEDITVVLYDANGNVVATTVTDANGDYSFTGLPDGTYSVDVTDDLNLLNGYWHSDGPSDGSDNNSQDDPYTVSVSGGATDTTGDFGYYVRPGALGNRLWLESDGDGIQETGEVGMTNLTVTLTIIYPGNITNTVVTSSDNNGFYSFGNLLLDEDQDGTGGSEPQFIISVESVSNFNHTLTDAGGDDGADSDEPSGTQGFTRQGLPAPAIDAAAPSTETSNGWVDFGFVRVPTLVVITAVRSQVDDGIAVISWDVAMEMGAVGYHLERETDDGWVRVNESLILADIFATGTRTYSQADPNAPVGTVQRYRIIEVDFSGREIVYGPYELPLDGGEISYAAWAEDVDWDGADSNTEADPDSDGLSNFEEYLAGTNPLDANSLLNITGLKQSADGIEVTWQSEAGKVYAVQMSLSLDGPFWPVATGIAAETPANTITVPVDFTSVRNAFFRVVVE